MGIVGALLQLFSTSGLLQAIDSDIFRAIPHLRPDIRKGLSKAVSESLTLATTKRAARSKSGDAVCLRHGHAASEKRGNSLNSGCETTHRHGQKDLVHEGAEESNCGRSAIAAPNET